MFHKISQFISSVKGELKKTTWPWDSNSKAKGFKKYRELWSSTLVVLVAMTLLGAFVATSDLVLAFIVNQLISIFS